MLGFGLNSRFDEIIYGNRNDVCCVCANDMVKNGEATDRVVAEEKLRGKLLNKPVFRVPINGSRYIICEDCLEHALSDISAEKQKAESSDEKE